METRNLNQIPLHYFLQFLNLTELLPCQRINHTWRQACTECIRPLKEYYGQVGTSSDPMEMVAREKAKKACCSFDIVAWRLIYKTHPTLSWVPLHVSREQAVRTNNPSMLRFVFQTHKGTHPEMQWIVRDYSLELIQVVWEMEPSSLRTWFILRWALQYGRVDILQWLSGLVGWTMILSQLGDCFSRATQFQKKRYRDLLANIQGYCGIWNPR